MSKKCLCRSLNSLIISLWKWFIMIIVNHFRYYHNDSFQIENIRILIFFRGSWCDVCVSADENLEEMTDMDCAGLLVQALHDHKTEAKVVKNACMALASLVEPDGKSCQSLSVTVFFLIINALGASRHGCIHCVAYYNQLWLGPWRPGLVYKGMTRCRMRGYLSYCSGRWRPL